MWKLDFFFLSFFAQFSIDLAVEIRSFINVRSASQIKKKGYCAVCLTKIIYVEYNIQQKKPGTKPLSDVHITLRICPQFSPSSELPVILYHESKQPTWIFPYAAKYHAGPKHRPGVYWL